MDFRKKTRDFFFIAWLLVAVLSQLLHPVHAADPTIDFVRDIQPLFVGHCYACHGLGKERGGLSLGKRSTAMAGGDHGPALIAGDSAGSALILRVTGATKPAMPLNGEALSPEQIGLLRNWIDQGAVWPAAAEDTDPRTREAKVHWSFLPLSLPSLPAVDPLYKNSSWGSMPIDRYIMARLKTEHLSPCPEADRVTLLRRVTFDLLGLTPSPKEIADFAADKRPQAYEELIDRLLASPHYGERWARHWLDVVRYSDSGGYDTDILYEQAWRYRNYCIGAFNADKPFDRFLEEQVAGDELWPEQAEAMADAVAVWTLGQWPNAFDAFPEKLEYVRRNDQVVTLSEAMLGLSVGCANCHQHKYDPISQTDYFGLEAIFAGSETFNRKTGKVGWVNGETSHFRGLRPASTPTPVHLLRRGELNQPAQLIPPGIPAFLPGGGPLLSDKDGPAQPRRTALAKWLTSPDNPLTARVIANRICQWHFGQGLVTTPNDFGTQGSAPSHPELLDWLAADLVDHGWSLKRMHRAIMLSSTYRQTSDRDPKAIRQDPDNLWLAGYSRRRMEAEAVWDHLLEASGRLEREPTDEPFVPPLSDEELQGLYDIGGKPRENKWKATAIQNRRCVYMLNRRSFRMPLLEAFDQPGSGVSCPTRQNTTVAAQALSLLNSDFVVEQAAAMHQRLCNDEPSNRAARVERAWLLAFARPIRNDERLAATRFLDQRIETLKASGTAGSAAIFPAESADAAAWKELCLSLMNTNEFVHID